MTWLRLILVCSRLRTSRSLLCGLVILVCLTSIPEYRNRNVNTHNVDNTTRHIAFVKTHKAASSTVLNILYRFARSRHLVLLLPKIGNYIHGRQLNKTSLMPPPRGRTYDILCNHAIFNHSSFSAFLPTDTQYVGIVREPYDRFVSAFYYYRFQQGMGYLRAIPGNYHSMFRTFLKHPSLWEPDDPMSSMTNNRMAIDFGFPGEHINNTTLFDEYLLHLNGTFKIVIIVELFDESLVLMKRAFNWKIKDILYTIQNRARYKPNRPLISESMKQNFRNISQLDNKLYRFFVKRLYSQMQVERDFKEEVDYFRSVKDKVGRYCQNPRRRKDVRVSWSKWTEAFRVTREECVLLQMEEPHFVAFIRREQNRAIAQTGANNDFMKTLP